MALSESRISDRELRQFLDEKSRFYNHPRFITTDPIQVPHRFNDPGDIEIAAFLTASIAWGRKESIISSASTLLSLMPGGPLHFILSAEEENLERFLPFVHRTFNGFDCVYFMKALSRIYRYQGGLRNLFEKSYHEKGDLYSTLADFRLRFFSHASPGRTAKHMADVARGSSAKRLNMFLRWMVRRDGCGVDFGLWEGIPMSALYIPLDVHTGTTARKLGLLHRKQNDWKAVSELTGRLRQFDPEDPVRFDFALFGLGSFESF